MLYNVYFDIASVLLTVILLFITYSRRIYPTKACSFYRALLFLNLITGVTDIFSAYTISYPSAYTLAVNYAVNIIYLLSHNYKTVVFLLYVIRRIRGNLGTLGERIFWIGVLLLDTFSVLTTPFTHLIIYFDERLQYWHGPLMPVLYVTAFAIMIYTLMLFYFHRRELNGYQMITNGFFLSLMMGAVIFQYFYPEFLIETLCVSLATLMMNVTLDNPAMYLYKNTYCFNQNAFNYTVTEDLKTGTPFSVVAFTFNDFSLLRKKIREKGSEELLNDAAKTCHKLFGQRQVYMLSSHKIAVFTVPGEELTTIDKISSRLDKEESTDGERITISTHYCVLRYPGYADTVADINDTLDYLLHDVYDNTNERVIYDNEDLLEARHRESLIVHKLRKAIRHDGFEVWFQPIFEQKTKAFISAEVLVRLRRKEGEEYIGPDEFIPIAERNGMIMEIGEIVFEKACRCFSENRIGELGIRFLEVNISRIQLAHPDIATRLFAICRHFALDPSRINLEITETATGTEAEKVAISRNIAALREKGFSFSLDDFGSGYSTATYLAEVPFNIVKVDREVLWKAMKDNSFRNILESLISLVKKLGKLCVVEGVETVEMENLLRSLGCDFYQGYFYSKPLALRDFSGFLCKANAPQNASL